MDSLTELLDDCEHEIDGIRDAARKIASDQVCQIISFFLWNKPMDWTTL